MTDVPGDELLDERKDEELGVTALADTVLGGAKLEGEEFLFFEAPRLDSIKA